MPVWYALLVLLLTAGAAPAQPAPQPHPDAALGPEVQEQLRLELTTMLDADQRARYMEMAGTFSPCTADSIRETLQGISVEERFARERALQAATEAQLSEAAQAALQAHRMAVDASNLARLQAMTERYGWPDSTRIGGSATPFVFLLHAGPETLTELLPLLRSEVDAGRMPPIDYARAVDKVRQIEGEPQLYGTADVFDAETRTVGPPRIRDIDETNAARAAIGLPPLERYQLADQR